MKLYVSGFVSGGNSRGETIGLVLRTEADLRLDIAAMKQLNRRDYAQLSEFIKSDKLYDICRCDGESHMLIELNYNGDEYIRNRNTPQKMIDYLLEKA